MDRGACYPRRGQYSHVGAIFEQKAHRAGMQLRGVGRSMYVVDDNRDALALARGLSFHVEKLRRMRHRLKHHDMRRRERQR